MARVSSINSQHLQAICDVLAATSSGLTGGEITRLLRDCGIADPTPGDTKRHRLFAALSGRQQQDGCANNVLAFIAAAMNPVRYVSEREKFDRRRNELNEVLVFAGLRLEDSGQLVKTDRATTLAEAQKRAGGLRRKLRERGVHPDVLRFCQAELLQDNYFHAVFEATKSVADKIREQGEHRGLTNLLKGLFGTFRNVTAHAPKLKWSIGEQDALDMLSLASLLHRRLDEAVRTQR